MIFKIKKRIIETVLGNIQSLTSRKSSLGLTNSVLIETIDNQIKIVATDLETGVEGFYPAQIDKHGSILLNARKLYEIIKDYPSEEIIFNEKDKYRIKIGDDHIEYHIIGLDPENFPLMPQIENIPFFEMDSFDFKKMIENSIIVTALPDEKRPHLKGVFFEIIDTGSSKNVRMVSTDIGRLTKTDYQLDQSIDPALYAGALIPKKGIGDVAKFLDTEGIVLIGIKDGHLIIKKETEIIYVRLIEGNFPKYNQITDHSNYFSIRIEKTPFLQTLKRMAILTSEEYRSAIFRFENENINISAANPDYGDSKEDIQIKYTGETITTSFNIKYFIDALNVITDSYVILYLCNEDKPCMIKGEQDHSFICVIMPMRV